MGEIDSSTEAIAAATVHAEAVERARSEQIKTAIQESEDRTMKTFAQALKSVFSETKRFDDMASGRNVNIDVVANDISNIKDVLGEVKVSVAAITSKMEKDFVTRVEFDAKVVPMQKSIWYVATTVIGLFLAGLFSLLTKIHA